MKKMILLASLMLIASALQANAANVTYSNAERRVDPEAIIFDRNGDLYPPANVALDSDELLWGNGDSIASLREHYREARASNNREWQTLLSATGVTDAQDFDHIWVQIQDHLRQSKAAQLDQDAAGGRTLVLLVHGYNNTYTEAMDWYALVAPDIHDRVPDAAIVRVYWDGLTADGLVSNPLTIWDSAQWNFPRVGLELRRLLAATKAVNKLRILTHSTGGPLVANALGDASAPFDLNLGKNFERAKRRRLDDDYFRKASGELPGYELPDIQDVRVAMIAPAASLNTFDNFGSGYRIDRLVLGANPEDLPTSKMILNCKRLGATCLTTKPEAACRVVLANLKSSEFSIFNFEGAKRTARSLHFWESHAIADYQRRDDWQKLLAHWLEDKPDIPDESEALCKGGSAS